VKVVLADYHQSVLAEHERIVSRLKYGVRIAVSANADEDELREEPSGTNWKMSISIKTMSAEYVFVTLNPRIESLQNWQSLLEPNVTGAVYLQDSKNNTATISVKDGTCIFWSGVEKPRIDTDVAYSCPQKIISEPLRIALQKAVECKFAFAKSYE